MPTSKYDFSSVEPEKDEEEEIEIKEPRRNFRIASFCRNCRYYRAIPTNTDRGFCRLGNLKKLKPRFDLMTEEEIIEYAKKVNWIPTHYSNLCDFHEMRARRTSIGIAEEWTNISFNFDGSRNYDADDLDPFDTDF